MYLEVYTEVISLCNRIGITMSAYRIEIFADLNSFIFLLDVILIFIKH